MFVCRYAAELDLSRWAWWLHPDSKLRVFKSPPQPCVVGKLLGPAQVQAHWTGVMQPRLLVGNRTVHLERTVACDHCML